MLRHADALPMPGIRSPLWPAALIHLLCVVACGVAVAAEWWPVPQWAWPFIEGVSAAAIGMVLGLPWWWLPINLLFFPAVYVLLGVEVPPSVFLVLFCVLILVNGAAWLQRVPLFLSSERAAQMVSTLLPQQNGFCFIDLGCGTGSLLTRLVRLRPDGHYTGVELAPLPYWLSRWRSSRERVREREIEVHWGDFWSINLSDYDVVYVYLSPAPMTRLWEKARREMRHGSLLVSNGFCIPGVPPVRTIAVGDHVRSTLYVWRM